MGGAAGVPAGYDNDMTMSLVYYLEVDKSGGMSLAASLAAWLAGVDCRPLHQLAGRLTAATLQLADASPPRLCLPAMQLSTSLLSPAALATGAGEGGKPGAGSHMA